jgi:hypothetical protein
MLMISLLLLITLTAGIVLGALSVTALAIRSEDKPVRRMQVGVRRLCGTRIPSTEESDGISLDNSDTGCPLGAAYGSDSRLPGGRRCCIPPPARSADVSR